MKRISISILVAVSLLTGCAQKVGNGENYLSQISLNAWLHTYEKEHPAGYTKIGQGVYVFNEAEKPGTGVLVDGSSYIYADYTSRGLDGTITSTTIVRIAQQLGEYSETSYNGPIVWDMAEGSQYTGIIQAVSGMKVGGSRSVLVPRWMMTTSTYDTEQDYIRRSTSEDAEYIYDFKILDAFDDVIEWQVDSMEKFSDRYLDGLDSLCYGYYYKQLREPVDTTAFPKDSTAYIRYTGRLLNGLVFDTNIKDTAKVHKIYSTSKTYEPSEITWDSESEEYQLDGSSIIDGFAKALYLMRSYEKTLVMFSSDYGYGSSSSGTTIPAYSPLIFEIEYVDKPED